MVEVTRGWGGVGRKKTHTYLCETNKKWGKFDLLLSNNLKKYENHTIFC